MKSRTAERNPRDYQFGTPFLVFVAVVAWLFGAFVLWARLVPGVSAQWWEATRCEVFAVGTHVDKAPRHADGHEDGCLSDTEVVDIGYRYRAAGRRYEGRRYNFDSNRIDGSAPARGDTVDCYYDPDDPSEAVIDRSIPFGLVDISVLGVCLFLTSILGIRVVNAFRYPPLPRPARPVEPPPTHETREQMVTRVLEHLERSPLAAFPIGRGATRARVVAVDQPLTSPVTGISCVAYELTVSQRRGGEWVPLLADDRCGDFQISDDTGSGRVEGAGADLALDRPKQVDVEDPGTAPAKLAAVIARCAIVGSGAVRLTECVLEVGGEIVVCGVGAQEPDPTAAAEGGYRDAPPTRLVIRRGRDFPLAVSNHPAALEPSGERISPQLGPDDA